MLVEDAGLFGRLERDAVKMVFLQVKSGVVSDFFVFVVWFGSPRYRASWSGLVVVGCYEDFLFSSCRFCQNKHQQDHPYSYTNVRIASDRAADLRSHVCW